MQTAGPIDPNLIAPSPKLPSAKGFKKMRSRIWNRFRGRLHDDDFNLTFNAVHAWLEGREITFEQARYSAQDIAVSMCGVAPLVILQRCEETKICLLTLSIKTKDKQEISKTRKINIIDKDPQLAHRSTKKLHQQAQLKFQKGEEID